MNAVQRLREEVLGISRPKFADLIRKDNGTPYSEASIALWEAEPTTEARDQLIAIAREHGREDIVLELLGGQAQTRSVSTQFPHAAEDPASHPSEGNRPIAEQESTIKKLEYVLNSGVEAAIQAVLSSLELARMAIHEGKERRANRLVEEVGETVRSEAGSGPKPDRVRTRERKRAG